jgi:hypothetical protein
MNRPYLGGNMSSQVRFQGLMFATRLVGDDAFSAMRQLLPTDALRKAFQGQIPHLNELYRNVTLGTHGEYQWLVTSQPTPFNTVLLVERADKASMGVGEGLQIEQTALASASRLTAMITHIRPYNMETEAGQQELHDNIQKGRHWAVNMPR